MKTKDRRAKREVDMLITAVGARSHSPAADTDDNSGMARKMYNLSQMSPFSL